MCTFSYILEQSGLNKSEFAKVLGIPPSAVTTRINGTDDIKISELEKVESFLGKKLFRASDESKQEYDQVQIPYIHIEGENDADFKHEHVKERVQFDKEIVKNLWAREPENLRIMTMPGNNMNGGGYPLKNKDILIVDISEKARNCNKSGIFVHTSDLIGVRVTELQLRSDGKLLMLNLNPTFKDEEYTPEQLKAIGFKVIGRMVKNLSLTK